MCFGVLYFSQLTICNFRFIIVWANLTYVIVPIPLPLSTVQILVVDLGFELLMALSYAYDPSEDKAGLMKLPPRKPVTEQSIARLQRRLAREKAERIADGLDPEMSQSKEQVHRAGFSGLIRKFKRRFTSEYWKEAFEKTEDEVLVDSDVLLWSFLEAGSIQTIGCFTAYFFAMWYHGGVTPYQAMQYAMEDSSWGANGKEFINSAGKFFVSIIRFVDMFKSPLFTFLAIY